MQSIELSEFGEAPKPGEADTGGIRSDSSDQGINNMQNMYAKHARPEIFNPMSVINFLMIRHLE